MTWTRLTQSPVSVTAWGYEVPEQERKVRLGVGASWADLSIEDATSLGDYLLFHATKKGDQ